LLSESKSYLSRNKKIECYIKDEDHKLITLKLRFLVERDVNSLCG